MFSIDYHSPKPSTFAGMPVRLQLKGWLILYIFDQSPGEDFGTEKLLTETTLNTLLATIGTVLMPPAVPTVPGSEGKFTLGGLVMHCWVEGDTDLDPGICGAQAAAILPINILM